MYTKSGSLHMAKMKSLPSDALERLYAGEFGVQWKEKAPFSSVDIDYATELLNSISKSAGGLSDMTQNDSATLK